MFGSNWFQDPMMSQPRSRPSSRYAPEEYYGNTRPFGGYDNSPTQRRRMYLMKQERAERAERLRQQREQQALAVEVQRREELIKRKLFLLKAKMATRTIQRAWRAHRQRRVVQLHALRDAAALIITRAMKNFGPIFNAKRVIASLRQLKSLEDQVEAVDPATAVRTGKGITLFEHTIDKVIAQLDLIDSWGSQSVRARRKRLVIRADERVRQILAKEDGRQQTVAAEVVETTANMDVEEDEVEDEELSSESESEDKFDDALTDGEMMTDTEIVDVETQQQHTPPPPKTYASAITDDNLAQLSQKVSVLTEQFTCELDATKTQVDRFLSLRDRSKMDKSVIESLMNKLDRIEAALKLLRA